MAHEGINWDKIHSSQEPLDSAELDKGRGSLIRSEFDDLPVGYARPNWAPLSQAEKHVIDLVAYEMRNGSEQAIDVTGPELKH